MNERESSAKRAGRSVRKFLEEVLGIEQPTPKRYGFTPDLMALVEAMPPGQLLKITATESRHELAIMDYDDFEHVAELAGLRLKNVPPRKGKP